MPLMRNPFRRNPADVSIDPSDPRPLTSPPHRPTAIDIKGAEYKLSEINDSGVFLPPSPPAKDTPRFWAATRSSTSTSSSSYRSAITEDDNPFTISRESCDSYRRSFDISARSPIQPTSPDTTTTRPRHSLDAARMRLPPPRLKERHFNPPETQPEDRFEDVGLGGEEPSARVTKKPSLFSRFGGGTGHASAPEQQQQQQPQQPALPSEATRPSSSHFPGRELFGRRRAQSTGAAELKSLPLEGPD